MANERFPVLLNSHIGQPQWQMLCECPQRHGFDTEHVESSVNSVACQAPTDDKGPNQMHLTSQTMLSVIYVNLI